MNAPKARKTEKILTVHNDTRIDPYFWMNERENPEVIQYLEEENAYSDFVLKDTEDLQNELFEEMKARYKKDDESLPYFFNGYWYIVRYEEGREYPIFSRKFQTLENEEEILLDANILAGDEVFFETGSISVSVDNEVIAYSTDTVGRRIYTIFFKNIKTGKVYPDIIENTTGKAVWAGDNEHVFYIRKDASLRAFQIYRHKLGTDPENDILIYHEKDETFDVSLFKTKSLEYIFIASSSTNEDEMRFIPANNVFADWKLIQPRTEDLEYSVEHYQDDFYIITNADDATNFKIVKTKVETPSLEYWEDYIPHREDVLLEGFEIFRNYFVLEERQKGLLQINIIDNQNNNSYYLPFSDPTYTAYIGINMEFDTDILRFGYTSLTKPASTYEYNMKDKTTTLLKQQEVLGGKFFPENYISERIWAIARDGKEIAISLVYHKNTPKSADTPLLLYGYGSYGHTVDATFSSVRLSLLDRGFIYAIAHIRGGEYLGREWYEDGKMLIEPVKSENGKLEGVLSRKVPSHLTLETPRVKMNMQYDRHSPVKMFKLDYDGIHLEKHTDLLYEPGVQYKIIGNGKIKDDGSHYSIDIQGKPRKAFKLDADMMNFKLNVNKPEDSNKAQFSYTFNDYTETEEYEFDPHRAYYINWISSIRKYIQNFIVEDH